MNKELFRKIILASKNMHLNDLIQKYDIKSELENFFYKIYTKDIIAKFYHNYVDSVKLTSNNLTKITKEQLIDLLLDQKFTIFDDNESVIKVYKTFIKCVSKIKRKYRINIDVKTIYEDLFYSEALYMIM